MSIRVVNNFSPEFQYEYEQRVAAHTLPKRMCCSSGRRRCCGWYSAKWQRISRNKPETSWECIQRVNEWKYIKTQQKLFHKLIGLVIRRRRQSDDEDVARMVTMTIFLYSHPSHSLNVSIYSAVEFGTELPKFRSSFFFLSLYRVSHMQIAQIICTTYTHPIYFRISFFSLGLVRCHDFNSTHNSTNRVYFSEKPLTN